MKTTAFAAALAVAVGFFLPASAVAQQPAHLVKDINPGVDGEIGVSPSNLVAFNGAVYYSGYDDFHGQALWRSDGTPQGTRMIFDFTPGWNSDLFTLVSRREGLVIVHESGEVWTSDGTAANTRRVARLEGLSNAGYAVSVGSLVFFLGHSNAEGWLLARTDGTPQGSFVIHRLALSGWKTVAAANLLYFQTGTDQWWRSDGTATGTFPVASTGVYLLSAAAIGDRLFFAKCEPAHGCELWRTDGTLESTGLVADLEPGPGSSGPHALSSVGSALYFGTSPRGVWRSDGSAAGTTRVATDISVAETPYQLTPAFVGTGAAAIFIGANDDGMAFWRTGGTPAVTRKLAPVTSLHEYVSDVSLLGDSTAAYATLARWTSTGEVFREVWRVTDAIAQRLEQTDSQYGWYGNNLLVSAGRAFYASWRIGSGPELWIADAAGTHMVADTAPASSAWPWQLRAGGSTLFLIADANHDPVTPSYGEIWKSDGTKDGTRMVKDMTPGLPGSSFENLVAAPGRLYFTRSPTELWTSDGTPDGTTRIAADTRGDIGLAGSTLFFSRMEGSSWALWKTDGTPGGTVRVKALPTAVWQSPAWNFTAVGDRLYFNACTAEHGCEPWMTDGTDAGTRMVADVAPGPASSWAWSFTALKSEVFFFTPAPSQLWKTDGTPQGTVVVHTSPQFSSTNGVIALEDRVVFAITPPTFTSTQLWSADGTPTGTKILRELPVSRFATNIWGFARIGNLALFAADDGIHGYEVWRTDGTSEGTAMVVDLAPGKDNGIDPGNFWPFLPIGLRAAFAGTTREFGSEVFVTDGTAPGTRLLTDINPGPEPANPYEMVVAGANLFVAAGRPDVGFELWTVVVSPAGALDDLAQDLDGTVMPDAARQSLKAKLQAVEKALQRGDAAATAGVLGAFISQLEALAGKIAPADAAALIDAARRILESLSSGGLAGSELLE